MAQTRMTRRIAMAMSAGTRLTRGIAAAALALVAVTAHGAEVISSPSGIDSRLRFEWEVGRTFRGQPLIQGYIYNDYMRAAYNVRLLVETLDAGGQVIDT